MCGLQSQYNGQGSQQLIFGFRSGPLNMIFSRTSWFLPRADSGQNKVRPNEGLRILTSKQNFRGSFNEKSGKGANYEEVFEHVLRGVSGCYHRGGNRRGREG